VIDGARRRMPRTTVVLVAALTGAQAGSRPACASGPGDAGDREQPHGPVVELSVIADEASAARLRDVLLEQLGGAGVAVKWRRSERFQPDDLLSPPAAQQAAGLDPATEVSVWIDLSAPTEARLYLKDIRGDRFVVRRLLLPRGVDEIAREEIGHIVRSATLGVLAGSAPALTREEARAALEAPPPAEPLPSSDRPPARRAPPPPPLPSETATQPAPHRTDTVPAATLASAGALAVEIGASWAVQPFAPRIWWTHEAAISAALRPGGGGWWGVWLEAGHRLPVDFREEAIGVGIDASSLRLGATVDLWSGTRLTLRLGGGAGVEWITFQPRAGTAPAELAPRDSFLVPSARVFVGGAFHLVTHAVLTLRLLCDIEATDVHYDIEDSAGGGGVRRALTPFRLRPGLSLGIAWRS
jgi:hypothetical protein